MIKPEDIFKLIEEQKEKCKPDTAKEIELNQLINEAVGKFSVAIEEGDEQEWQKYHGEIKKLKEELSQLEDLNASKDSGAFGNAIKSQGKLPKLCKEFEIQQLKLVDGLFAKEEAYVAKVTKAKDALLGTIKGMRETRQEIVEALKYFDYLREYTPNPYPNINGSAYEYCKSKMTQLNFSSTIDQIRHASGVF